MPTIPATYRCIKTTRALEILQDMVVTGNQIDIVGFSVSSTMGNLDPSRTMSDLNPTWYPISGSYAPMLGTPETSGTTLRMGIMVPAGVTTEERYISEIYVFAQYQNEVFLFAIGQTQDSPYYFMYIPNTSYTLYLAFDMAQYEGSINIIFSNVLYDTAYPLYYEGSTLNLDFDETLDVVNNKLSVANPIPALTGNEGGFLTNNSTKTFWSFNRANIQLSNLNDIGEKRLNAVKGYLENGNPLTDIRLVKDVSHYAHSTFDISKFTVTGTPTITDDGIASGFSNSNYLSIPIFDVTQKNYTVSTTINYVQGTGQNFIFGNNAGTLYRLAVITNTNKLVLFAGSNQSSWNIADSVYGTTELANNHSYQVKFVRENGTVYKVLLKDLVTNEETTEITINSSSDLVNIPSTNMVIGMSGWTPFAGSIDLKAFSITVDGVPVFNGNETGVDIVKPNNYTVEGTPVITDDGIASSFSTSNYLTTDSTIDFNSANSWMLIASFTTPSSFSPENSIYSGNVSYSGVRLFINSSGKISSALSGATSGFTIGTITGDQLVANTKYWAMIAFDGTTYALYYSTNSRNFYRTGNVISSTTKVMSAVGKIGVHNNNTNPMRGSIDLNSIKIYLDGNLVYQPCLLIPYTESSTGSLVVDSTYRDRVEDVYTQFGSANYYTLQSDTVLNYKLTGASDIDSNYIASNFSNAKYITGTPLVSFIDDFSVQVNERRNSNTTFSGFSIVRYNSTSQAVAFVQPTGSSFITLGLYIGGTLSTYDYQFTHENYTDIVYTLAWDGAKYTLKILDNTSQKVILSESVTSSTALSRSGTILGYLIIGYNFNPQKTMDSADLKLCKISNNNITQEIISLANTTLPMGEIYGLMHTVTDGRWLNSKSPNINLTSVTAVGTYDIDLSGILPNDGYSYECLCRYNFERRDDSSEDTGIKIFSSDGAKTWVWEHVEGYPQLETNYVRKSGQFVVIVDNSRKLKIDINTKPLNTSTIDLIMYRRCGGNY